MSLPSAAASRHAVTWAKGAFVLAEKRKGFHMKIAYLSIQRVTGLIGLPVSTDCELLKSAQARAFLTVGREPYYLHLRRCEAYGTMIAQMLVNNIAGPLAAPERFAAALSSAEINERFQTDRPLLVIESTSTIDSIIFDRLNDMGTCCLGLNLFDQTAIAEVAKTALEAAISGIALILPSRTTPTVEALGKVAYAIEPETGRFLYSLEPSVSASMTSMTSIDTRRLGEAVTVTQSLFDNRGLQTVVHLLARSLQTTDDLQAFLTAWAGLEIFLDKTFETHKQILYTQMKTSIAPTAGTFVDRLQRVIETGARYNVRDKFTVVSSFLSSADALNDIELFRSVKETRDSIHVMKLRPHGYPTSVTQNLLRKYLRLHLYTSA